MILDLNLKSVSKSTVMKIIPVYLPQFHSIPENDKWWGKGFTEWINVKKAKPLFAGHNQPKIPLDQNYYDLSDIETLRWQAKIAKEHGIYGFCFYHYWFNGTLLLEKPMEMLLNNKDIDIKFCISWANHNWENTWSASEGNEKILIAHDFDDETDWPKHFNYMLKFFKDSRYIIENNKPLLTILTPNSIGKLNKLLSLWNTMAVDAGFDGMKFAFQGVRSHYTSGWDRSMFDYAIEFQPSFLIFKKTFFSSKLLSLGWINYMRKFKKFFAMMRRLFFSNKSLSFFDYDEAWAAILATPPSSTNAIPSAFVDWDNTPRKGKRGGVCINSSPEKFKKYFTQLLIKTRDEYKQDKIFVFAWNEWAEGGYLEPDVTHGYGYLNAIKASLKEFELITKSRR